MHIKYYGLIIDLIILLILVYSIGIVKGLIISVLSYGIGAVSGMLIQHYIRRR